MDGQWTSRRLRVRLASALPGCGSKKMERVGGEVEK